MKTLKTFSIDHEIVIKLQEQGNQSQLINKLLNLHFNGATSLEETKKLIKTKEDEILILQDEIKGLKPKLDRLNRPKTILERCRY